VWQIAVEFIKDEVVDGVLADHMHVAEAQHNKWSKTMLRFGACGGIVVCLADASDAKSFCCRLLC
jgi:hypothetical protein